MKLITCSLCGEKLMGPKSDRWPGGAPVIMGRWVGGTQFPVAFKCRRCTGVVRLSVVEFNRLPSMTAKEVQELAPSAQVAVD